MVSGIGGSGGFGSYATQVMQRQGPGPQDLFKKVDSDASGGVSQAELKTMAEEINSKTGKTLGADETSFSGYDSDGSGTLSEEELMAVMNSNGFGPPSGMEGGEKAMGPPPPPPKERATAAYAANSGEDSLFSLITGLQQMLEQLQTGATGEGESTTDNGGSRRDPLNLFGKADSDGSGVISRDELATMADNLEQMSGQAISVDDDTFGAADSDSDGSLNADELKSFMDVSGFAPPPSPNRAATASSGDDATATSSSATTTTSSVSNTGKSRQEKIELLQAMLERLTKLNQTGTTGIASLLNVTA